MINIKGFALSEQGDVLVQDNEIQMVHGSELKLQTIKTTLATQKGEWFLNWEQGINYNNILGKKRYSSKNDGIANQYIKEIQANDENNNALNEKLARRLDGVD